MCETVTAGAAVSASEAGSAVYKEVSLLHWPGRYTAQGLELLPRARAVCGRVAT